MMRYTLPQLEALVWICRLGSFRAAAAKLNVTQPTVSLRIRDLEAGLGTRVFESRGGAMKLTPQGAVLLDYAERGFELFDEMEDRLKTRDPLRGLLRLGSADTFAITTLPLIIRRVELLYPRLKVELTVDNSTTLHALIASRKLDLAFLNNPARLDNPAKINNVVTEPLGALDIAWVSGTAERIGKRTLRPSDIGTRTVFLPPRASPLSEIFRTWIASADCPVPPVSTCNKMSVIARLLATGNGLSLLPLNFIEKELEAGILVRYREKPAFEPLTLCAAYQEQAQSAGIAVILDIARDVVRRSGFLYRP